MARTTKPTTAEERAFFREYIARWPEATTREATRLFDDINDRDATIAALREQLATAERERAELEREIADSDMWVLLNREPEHADHACAQCVPDGPGTGGGYVCIYHRAYLRECKRRPAPVADNSPACASCGHERAAHKEHLAGICIGCPCAGYVAAALPEREEPAL